jgi:hypothetical protein
MPRLRVWPVYLIALPVLVAASVVVESFAIAWINSFHVPGTLPGPIWVVIAVNLVPTFLSGFLIIFFLGTVILRRKREAVPAPHAIRAVPLYVLAATLGAYVAYSHNLRGWGLVGQLFVWPFVTCLGGVLGDAAAGRASRSADDLPGRI